MKKSFLYLFLSAILTLSIISCGNTTGKVEDTEEQWIAVTSMDQLKGIWEDENGKIEFPKKLENTDYLLITGPQIDDSDLWMNYAKQHNILAKQVWAKKYAAIAEIYGVNYPIADSNGTQRGIKFLTPKIFTDYYIEVITHTDTLIPEEIIYKNLPFFSISKDGTKLKESGTFRYYSSQFKNEYVEERILTRKEN